MECACVILFSVACLVLEYFATLSHKSHEFLKRVIKYKLFVFRIPLQSLSEIFRILRTTERDMIKNVYWSLGTAPLFLSDIINTLRTGEADLRFYITTVQDG